MSQQTYAVDALARHQVFLQRYGTSEVNRLLPIIDQMRKDLVGTIANTEFQRQRIVALERELVAITNAAMLELNAGIVTGAEKLAEYEAGFTNRFLDGMLTVESAAVDVPRLMAAVNTAPMTMVSGSSTVSLTVTAAAAQFAGSTSQTLVHTLQSGVAEGKTTAEMVKEVGRIVNTRTKAQAEALIRTSANHAGTVARSEVYRENADVIEQEKYVAVLDNRTTIECAGNDGKYFDIGKGPHPPLHFNCRSIRIPVIKKEFLVADLKGDRPAKSADGAERISGQSTYGGWLRKQPASFQNEALGKARAKLFRNGGLSIDKFTNDNSIVYSLHDLRRLEPQAFERAGM